MSKKQISKKKALKEKIRLLEIENSDWTDRAEDVFLFASTAESISSLTDEKDVYETALEKISIMKDIPYCAFGTIGNGELNIINEYASFTEDENIAKISLSPSLKEKVLQNKIVVEKYFKSHHEINISFNNINFTPKNILIISFTNLRNHDGIFICIDKSKDDRLDTIRETLKHSVTLVNNRLDNLYLMHQLSIQNKNLEIKVAESTGELEEEIKEHIVTEDALRESEDNFKSLIEQSPFVVEVYNLDGLQILVNRAYEVLWGFSAETTVNKFNVLKSKEVEKTGLMVFVKRAYNGESVTVPEYTFDPSGATEADGEGRVRWLNTRIYPIKEKSGRVKSIVITHQDVTNRKLAEKAQRRSDSKYRALFEGISDAVFVHPLRISGFNRFVEVNKVACKLYGYSREEFLGLSVKEISAHEDALKWSSGEGKEQLLKNRWMIFEAIHITKDGRHIPVEISSRIFDLEGESAILSLARDITKRKQAEEELIKSKERAENADKMKSIFLAQMSHEIRTPINALVSMSSLLRYDFEEDATKDQLMSFDIIDRAGGRIIRTIDLLLNLSEIQAGTYEINLSKFDIFTDVISQIVAENKILAKNKNIELNLIYSVQNSELVADQYTVAQIFTQLIDNAIKYTEEGEVSIKIIRNKFKHLIVEINDTGIGIDKEYLPKIFEQFSQEEMGYTRKFEGNGIGLALVKKYCELNKAKVEVESKKGKGSTFRIIFY